MLALAAKPTCDRNFNPGGVMQGENYNVDHFTPNDRRELIETGVNLKNLAAVVTRLETSISTNSTELGRRMDKFDERVRALENFRYYMLGAAAGAGALAGYLGRLFHP